VKKTYGDIIAVEAGFTCVKSAKTSAPKTALARLFIKLKKFYTRMFELEQFRALMSALILPV
jgi:hypothetical protein